MYPYKALLTLGTLAMSLGVSSTAKASDLALSFELPPSPQAEAEAAAIAEAAATPPEPLPPPQALVNAEAPLPIPAGAENPPMAGDNTRPPGVYGGLDAIAIGGAPSVQALLPPPPPVPNYLQPVPVVTPPPAPADTAAAPPEQPEQLSEQEIQDQVEFMLGFQEKTFKPVVAETTEPDPAEIPQPQAAIAFAYSWENFETLFSGGSDSLVAWAVGSAEGTRTPNGHKNPAYYGHVDPGNGVWNMGTFSYQHGAASPEEADVKQLQRLQSQTEQLRQKALAKGLHLSKEELLNGIDLANQAPLAALDRGGYIDWLQKAHNLGMEGQEAIVWARTRSFIDPDTQRWNAPGLGNNVYSISHDQERRAIAIARAIAAFMAQTQIAVAPAPAPVGQVDEEVAVQVAAPEPRENIAFSLPLQASDAPAQQPEAIAADPATEPASATDATATIEQDEEVVALADPGTGLLLTVEPGAQNPTSSQPKAAQAKLERPVFSRLNRTLARMFNGGNPEPVAEGEETAIAPATATDSNQSPAGDSLIAAEVQAEATPPPAEPEAIAAPAAENSPALLPEMPESPAAQTPDPTTETTAATPLVEDDATQLTDSDQESPTAIALPAPESTPSTEIAAAQPAEDEQAIAPVLAEPVDPGAAPDAITAPVAAAEPLPPAPDESAAIEFEQVAAAAPEPAIAPDTPNSPTAATVASPPVKRSKAPAPTTDAFDLGKTLDSLNQLQQQIRKDLGT